MIILPSQARDKHRESTQNEMRFSQLHLWLQAAAHSQGGALADKPVFVRAHRWGSGLATEPLGLNEPALSIEPWGLVVAGDYLGFDDGTVEGAMLSGLEAANRVSQWGSDFARKLDQHTK